MPFNMDAVLAATVGQDAPQQRQSSFGAELESAVRNYVATFGHIAGALGIDAAREWAREQEEKAADAAARSNWTQSYKDIDLSRPSTLAGYIAHLGMQYLPYAAEAITAAATLGGTEAAMMVGRAGLRVAGREATEQAARAAGRTAAAVAGSYPSSVGSILSAQDEQAGEYNAPAAAALGVPYAGLNAFGLEGAMARRSLGGAVGASSRLGRAVGTGLRVGASEAANEAGQQVVEEIGRRVVDPSHSLVGDEALDRYAESAIGGLVLGGATGGARGVFSRRPVKATPTPISDGEPTNLLNRSRPGDEEEHLGPVVQPVERQPMVWDERLGGETVAPPVTWDERTGATINPPPSTAQGLPTSSENLRWDERLGAYVPVEPAPPAPLALPAPQGPTLYVDQTGNVGTSPNLNQQILANARPGETLDMFTRQPGAVLPEVEADRLREEITQELDRREQQEDLFASKPTATVNTDFSLRHIRQRILAATGGRQDAYTLQVGTQLARLLAVGKDAEAARFLAGEQQKLETAKISRATLEHRLRTLVAAERTVADYAARMDDARRQEATVAAEQGKAQAQPGVVVDNGPATDKTATIEQMREANAAPAPAPAPQVEAPVAPKVNTPEDIEATIANEAAERTRKERAAILQSVLDDPTTLHPVGRFRAALKKAGFKVTALTDEEAATIERFEQAKAAFTQPPPVEDRSGVEAIEAHIPERKAVQQPATRKAETRPKPAPAETASEKEVKESQAPEPPKRTVMAEAFAKAQADKAAREQAASAQAPEPPTADPEINALLTLVDQRNKAIERNDRKAIQAIDAAIDAQRRKIAASAPQPEAKPAAQRKVLTSEEVKERVLADRAARAQPATNIRAEITQALTDRRITPQQAANVRETLREDGEAAAREQLAGYLTNGPRRLTGTARDLSNLTVPDRTVEVEAREEGAPAELDFEREPMRPRQGGITKGMAVADVQSTVDRILKGWRNAPQVNVVASASDIPGLKEHLADSQGLYNPNTGEVWLIADNIDTPERAAAVLFHEGLGHYGLTQAFGNQLTQTLSSIYRTHAEMRRAADQYLAAHPSTYTGPDAQARAVEEVLAMAAEGGRPIPQSVMQRIKAAVLQFARRMGIYRGDFTNEEVVAIVNRAMREVMNGPRDPFGRRSRTTRGSIEARPATAGPNLASMAGLKSVVAEREGIFTDVKGKARRLRLASLFQRNLEELYGNLIPSLRTYNQMLFQMASKVTSLTSDAHAMLDRWNRLEGGNGKTAAEVQQEVGNLALEATFYQIRPDLSLDNEANSEIRDDADKRRYAAMKARYDALPEPARKLYTEIFDKFAESLRAKKALFKAQIQQSDLSEETKRRSDREIDAFFRRVKVYFPLMRFGEHIVIGRSQKYAEAEEAVQNARAALNRLVEDNAPEDQIQAAREALKKAREQQDATSENEGYVVRAFERESEAKREAKRLREMGFIVSERLAHDYQPELDGISAQFLTTIKDSLDAEGRKSAEARAITDHLKELFTQAYFQSLPESHALKRNLKRQFVAGYSEDAKRTFAAAMVRDAHYLARLEFGQKARDALEAMRKEAREADTKAQNADPNAPKLAQEVYEEVHKRHAASLRVVNTPVQDVVANVGYLWFLGFTPSFMVLNLMQTPLVTLPMLASRFGMAKSGSALAQAAQEVGRAQISAWRNDGAFGEIQIDSMALPEDERAMLRTLLDRGIIDLTQEHDLGTIAQGGNTKWRAMMRVASYLPHYTEKLNRLATALAAYRLAVQEKQANPGMRLDPVAFAEKAVADSHFDYSAENAPRWMRPGEFRFAKVVFQFRKYQMAMGYAIVNNFWQAVRNADPEERRIARRTLLGLLLTHGLAAGTLGLPGTALALAAANALNSLFGDDDEPWDAEVAYRNFLVDVFGGLTGDAELAKQMGEIVAHGVLRAPGIRDVVPGDISSRVGQGDLFTPVRTRKSDNEGRDKWNEVIASLMGPVGTVGGDVLEAIKYWSQGDIAKGVEIAMPKAVRDILRAMRFGTEGVTTARGNVVMSADQIPLGELVAQALGFTPSRIMESYEARSAIEGAKQYLQERRQGLLRRYAEAQLAGDAARVADARAAIQTYNAVRIQHHEPIIRAQDMLRAVQERRRYQRDLVNTARLRRNERALGNYGRFAVIE